MHNANWSFLNTVNDRLSPRGLICQNGFWGRGLIQEGRGVFGRGAYEIMKKSIAEQIIDEKIYNNNSFVINSNDILVYPVKIRKYYFKIICIRSIIFIFEICS